MQFNFSATTCSRPSWALGNMTIHKEKWGLHWFRNLELQPSSTWKIFLCRGQRVARRASYTGFLKILEALTQFRIHKTFPWKHHFSRAAEIYEEKQGSFRESRSLSVVLYDDIFKTNMVDGQVEWTISQTKSSSRFICDTLGQKPIFDLEFTKILMFEKCEFCQKWGLENVNFDKIDILKM